MSDRRLLAICYAFPPAAQPEAILAAKRLRNLRGWRANVVAAVDPWSASDPDLAAYAEAACERVTRVKYRSRIPARLLGVFGRIPDPLRLLNRAAVRAAEALNPDGHDAMLSWSNWLSSHLAALALKRRHPRLPWVAHFSDPWTDNPFAPVRGVARAINVRLEREVITAADRVLFTTPEQVDLVMAKYPAAWRDKVRMIPHGYDPQLYSGARPANGARRVGRYLGNFYGIRSPEPLFRALAVALRKRPRLAEEIVVEIVGKVDAAMLDTPAARALPPGLVKFRAPVGYRESLRLAETADFLLIVDAPARESVFLPSKLVDYLGAGRPIVALSPPGASARILRELGHAVVELDDVEKAADALIDAATGAPAPSTVPQAHERYSAVRTAAELAAILADVAGPAQRHV